ncbi:MAG: RNA polymerase factor sigma-54 [Betaproteobacteria bacterium]|jgi:RNA polymerase sigma-54 factor|nr:RNA polymerase factor sigma-54 [Betaproteobacteria bacterium]NBT11724.1 RNA polymerase factor sigma-54 [Betaproteobacteria bacterium]NBU50822.1 RNA polymerase factor sigma-54 [Betaproteobacteria bacterium]NBX95854.1 RNA polymerase factor sigma-54 [Betaproteobacteria bacterium]
MKTSLQVRLSQHLALTPQLQQSIRLLQLSTLELQQEVGQMLEANPFLEMEDDAPPAFEASLDAASRVEAAASDRLRERSDPASGTDDVPAASTAEASAEWESGESGGLADADFGTTAQPDWENGTESDDFDGIRELPSLSGSGSAANREDDDGPSDQDSGLITLAEHLQAQLAGMRLSSAERAALQVLIDSLNEDGWLEDSLDDIARSLLGLPTDRLSDASDDDSDSEDHPALEELSERLNCALKWLQALDPLGVGARNLPECLTLQLRAMTPNPERDLALLIVEQHLELLAKRDTKKLMAATGCDEQDLRWAQQLIRQCDPKPGRAFASDVGAIVIPDVIVQRAGRGFRVVLNPDVMPKLRINELYAGALKGRGKNASPLSSHLQEARWFMKNIQQRFDTILRVSSAIAERQKNFFTHGEIAMKPLVLREIADELGLHESTISRVTTAKYMATPFGTYELKYFFGSSLNTEAGGNASSTAVRALIKQFIAAEDAKKPLSDNHLSDMLAEQGIQVARRTVAKYREALKIAPASLRKTI